MRFNKGSSVLQPFQNGSQLTSMLRSKTRHMTMAEKVAKIALIFRALNRKMSWPLKPFQLGLRLVNCVRHNGKTIANCK